MADTKKKKSNLLEGDDPESAINAKYCEAIRKEMGKANAAELSKMALKKKAAKK